MKIGKTRNAFTLVELMIVVVIIAILAGLTTIGTQIAIRKAKNATVTLSLEQLSIAIERYKNEIGEYPPDFTDLDAVARHIRKRWPRCEYPDADKFLSYARERFYVDDNSPFGPASALVFWLGGLPDPNGKPAGFFLSPTNPLGVGDDNYELKSSQREEPRYDFPEGTIRNMEFKYERFEYNPDSEEYEIVPVPCHGPVFQPGKDDSKPVVYFCASAPAENDLGDINAEIENASYQLTLNEEAKYCRFENLGCAVPYAKSLNMNGYWTWHEPERFQLIHPGQDGLFSGEENYSHEHVSSYPYPFTGGGRSEVVTINVDPPINNLTKEDDDNIVSFAEGGTLESLYPQK